jgi:hypothetical protein
MPGWIGYQQQKDLVRMKQQKDLVRKQTTEGSDETERKWEVTRDRKDPGNSGGSMLFKHQK